MFNRLKNAETSKKLLVFIEFLLIITFVLIVVLVLKGDASAITAWITGLYALASISFSFYYWKAKAENIRKYSKKLSKEDIEKVAACYEAIFNEVSK